MTDGTQSDGTLYSSALSRGDAAAKFPLDRDGTAADHQPGSDEPVPALIDSLTGARVWDSGFLELRRDAQRAARTHQNFVLAFVDVDGLAVINDSFGWPSGDHVLKVVAATLRANLRSYDLVVRFGCDEFVCGIAGVDIAEAAARISTVNVVLASEPEHASVSVGIAQIQDGDTLDSLLARADAALYAQRRPQRRGTLES